MMKWIGFTGLLGLTAMLNACQPTATSAPPAGPPTAADVKQIEERVRDYFQKTQDLAPNITLKVIDVAPAAIPGLLTANLEASNGTNTQKVPLVLSRDGRFLIQGQLTDLSIDPSQVAMDKISLKDLPMRGNANAAVTIVEYSDFQCPFCSRAYKMIEDQVMKDYGDKVRLVYKNFPLDVHPWAEPAALAAACARRQSPEAFWKVYDFLFQNQQDITAENLKDKVQGLAGVDGTAFGACYDSRAAIDTVRQDQDEAAALGVRSTPTFFINGRKVEGAVPYETFKAMLDQALAGGKTSAGGAGNAQPTPNVVKPG
jgi:protein-disulfide isomerase